MGTLWPMEKEPLSNRIAVVTGASSGIGEATATALAARGAKVALVARRKERLDALAGRIREAGGHALALAVDIGDREAVFRAAEVVASELGVVDLLVNNAGVMLPAPIAERQHGDWSKMIDLNVTGVLTGIEAFLEPLVAAGAKGRADVINVSSIAAALTFPSFGVYCATKAAVTHLSRNLRTELGPKGVRVSVIEPGLVTTELADHVTDEGAKAWIEGARGSIEFLRAEDIAEAIAFTASLPARVNISEITVLPTQQV